MSTVIVRRLAATPTRTAAETWAKVVELLAPMLGGDARSELAKAKGAACASIAAEAIKASPIVVWGAGPRVRIYGVFDADAISGDGINEDPLPKASAGDWKMSIPCCVEDLAWMQANLAAASSRITARGVGEAIEDETGDTERSTPAMAINLTEFMKP